MSLTCSKKSANWRCSRVERKVGMSEWGSLEMKPIVSVSTTSKLPFRLTRLLFVFSVWNNLSADCTTSLVANPFRTALLPALV